MSKNDSGPQLSDSKHGVVVSTDKMCVGISMDNMRAGAEISTRVKVSVALAAKLPAIWATLR